MNPFSPNRLQPSGDKDADWRRLLKLSLCGLAATLPFAGAAAQERPVPPRPPAPAPAMPVVDTRFPDIHEVSGGKIVTTYHVEDWARTVRQLPGAEL